MRQGELIGLRWKDVDLVLGIASIQQTLYRLGKTVVTKEPKSARSRRTVALPPILVETLRAVQAKQDVCCGFRPKLITCSGKSRSSIPA